MSCSAAAARLLARLEALAPQFEPHFAQADRLARLPPEIAGPLLQEGFFRLWIPARCGGLELGLADALRLYEAAAFLDGSLGWALMIGAGGGLFAAWLPPAGARELFGPATALVGRFRYAHRARRSGCPAATGCGVPGASRAGPTRLPCSRPPAWSPRAALPYAMPPASRWCAPWRWRPRRCASSTPGTPSACAARAATTSRCTRRRCPSITPFRCSRMRRASPDRCIGCPSAC